MDLYCRAANTNSARTFKAGEGDTGHLPCWNGLDAEVHEAFLDSFKTLIQNAAVGEQISFSVYVTDGARYYKTGNGTISPDLGVGHHSQQKSFTLTQSISFE